MSTIKTTNLTVLTIGVITLGVVVFSLIKGATLNSQYSGIFFGVLLIGSALLNINGKSLE